MKIQNLLVAGFVCLTTTFSAMADFSPPTDAQIAAAAADPNQLAALMKDANMEQAAHIVKAVVAQMMGMDQPSETLLSHISTTINAAMTIIPSDGQATFAQDLGAEMGASLAIRSQASVVSCVQNTLISDAGTSKEVVGKAFGDAFDQASSGSSNPQNNKDSNKVKAPPDADLYPGQN